MSRVGYVVIDSRFILTGILELCTKKSSLISCGIFPSPPGSVTLHGTVAQDLSFWVTVHLTG